ncbi:hypothetical protein JZ751_023545 [Albula glossodonta]|uniref:Uncharacterized protein n=1 Tax=Albula glossodonta TaxID=121402 RepID=A0A8T2MQF3_9TELE|nr:hypothetical protein JZ751_007552 [Albula glossodonta]KAG9330629.1 hypothetical protein JZ751_023545 [Albula glossodonta]
MVCKVCGCVQIYTVRWFVRCAGVYRYSVGGSLTFFPTSSLELTRSSISARRALLLLSSSSWEL